MDRSFLNSQLRPEPDLHVVLAFLSTSVPTVPYLTHHLSLGVQQRSQTGKS